MQVSNISAPKSVKRLFDLFTTNVAFSQQKSRARFVVRLCFVVRRCWTVSSQTAFFSWTGYVAVRLKLIQGFRVDTEIFVEVRS